MQKENYKRNQGGRPGHSSQQGRNWENEFKERWITEGIDKECVDFASDFGSFVKGQGLSTSQIRNVFGELKRIQMRGFQNQNEKTAFILLKPKMAYSVKRSGRGGLKELMKVFNKAYNLIDTESEQGEKQFNNLVYFLEAVLAYHKSYGGK